MKKILLLLTLTTILMSCTREEIEPTIQARNITFELVEEGEYFNEQYALFRHGRVFNDETEWNTFIDTYNSGTQYNIDFNTYTIIAIFDHMEPSASASFTITSLTELENEITVETDLNIGDACMPTRPYHIVKIPKTTASFVFNFYQRIP